ncbi:MAG: chromosome segregation protein SMC [Firmicutes bacterium]|nr:chromosome segregation protein SMC [Bacillota bacterium]
MRLKRLEIQGFKSFARSVCLEFGPGITAIVGPNGSGKSNISDALRWVLGEQSIKSLRGSKMEDVIFAGSDGKKPLGMAEVQLTLDNSQGFLPVEYTEVTITRRVYRSGDSEFFINKQSCRLKDIHDLFTDTGLGRESYAVVGQGQIDAVLSVRSEDRRILLEETAGIVKYRQRKEQALRKLEETSVDLLRVTDVLHELEGQLGPLGEQAKKARLYLDLADKLQAAELDYYHLVWQNLDNKLKQNEQEYQDLGQEYQSWNQRLEELETRTAELEVRGQLLNDEIEQKQQELVDLGTAYNQGVHTIELHQDRIKTQEARSGQLVTSIAEYEEQLKDLHGENSVLKEALQKLLNEIAAQEQVIASAHEGMENLQDKHKQVQTEISKLKDEFFDFMRELAERRNFQRSFADRQKNLEEQISMNALEQTKLAERIVQTQEEIETLHGRLQEFNQELEKQGLEERQTQSDLAKAKVRLAKHQERRGQLESEIARVTSRLKTLQELEEGYEGYAFGVRRVMQHSEMAKLVLGTVADVVQVPQGLETAFEVALGASLQNLITRGEADAKKIISWLQRVQGGRVTILPLDSVQGVEFSSEVKELLQQPGVLGPALDLLKFSEQYRPALASLLGRVAITEDLDTALLLKRQLRQFSRLVTRDGSVVFPSGAMTGGSLNNRTSGLLARKGELSNLEEKLASLNQEVGLESSREQALTQEISLMEQALVKLQNEQIDTKLALQRTSQEQEQKLQETQKLRTAHGELEARLEELQTLLANLGSECEQAATQVSVLESEEAERRAQIQREEAELIELTAALDQLAQEETTERVRLAELKGELENQRIRLANLEQKKQASLAAQEAAREELTILAQDRLVNEQIILETRQANEERKQKQTELQAYLAQKKLERQEVQKENAQLGAELIQAQKEQLKRERALYKLEVEMGQVEQSREQIRTVLAERELTLASILNREVSEKESTLKKTIETVRGQIRALGLVNPAANEEYERVLERCSFMQTQLADLDEARASLQDVINEMDKLCRTKLQEVFEQVRLEFQRIFSRLFVGGTADLILTDPESILTTGIDVMAKPPGKKLQNLLLLSGGERALTAIALLFAIRRVKPIPFWVLDEIDAALDESNLIRFNELMDEFSQETQFLVVTHRQRTMEMAHSLYGVTMGDQGFSQIISVALN